MIISQKKTAEEIHHYSRCTEPKYYLLIFSGTLILHARKANDECKDLLPMLDRLDKLKSRGAEQNNFQTFELLLHFLAQFENSTKKKKMGINALHYYLITVHIFSIKAKSKLGFRFCLTGHFIASFAFSDFAI